MGKIKFTFTSRHEYVLADDGWKSLPMEAQLQDTLKKFSSAIVSTSMTAAEFQKVLMSISVRLQIKR
jgi:hypothetical protein